MSFFIRTPDNKKVQLYYRNNYTDFQKKTELVNDYILTKYNKFIDNAWFNPKTKYMLDQCANFLLLNETKGSKTLSKYKTEKIHQYEKPESSQSSSVNDYLYSSIFDSRLDAVRISNVSGEVNNNIEKPDKKYKQTPSYKINHLYSKKGRKTYIEYDVTDKDGNKVKNIFNSNVKDIDYCVVGKRNGIFEPNQHIISEWCLVDTDGYFYFDGRTFFIPANVKQYQPEKILVSGRKKQKSYEYKYDMERILAYHYKKSYFFFDENITDITGSIFLKNV